MLNGTEECTHPQPSVVLSEAKDLCSWAACKYEVPFCPRQNCPVHLSHTNWSIRIIILFMDPGREFFVYIMTNRSRALYTGVTNSLRRRVWQHKTGEGSEFAQRYKLDRLVYYERFEDIRNAIAREKQIKGWLRIKKISLIVSMNPSWKDLSEGWYQHMAVGSTA